MWQYFSWFHWQLLLNWIAFSNCKSIYMYFVRKTEIFISLHSHEYSRKKSYSKGLPWQPGKFQSFLTSFTLQSITQYSRWTTGWHLYGKHLHSVLNQSTHPAINSMLTASSVCQYWCANRPKFCCLPYFFTFTSPWAEYKQHNISSEDGIKNS